MLHIIADAVEPAEARDLGSSPGGCRFESPLRATRIIVYMEFREDEMEYFISKIDSLLSSKTDECKVIFAGNGITVEAFHLKTGTSLFEDNKHPSYSEGEKRTICYIVEKGSLEYWIGEERVVVSKGNCITLMPEDNFSVWAKEDSVVIAIHNNVEPDVDNTPAELVDAVTKVELQDSYLRGHNYRVGKYSTLMMQIICPERVNYAYSLSATYHDVGKMVVSESILNKTEKLTEEEFDEIKKHPAASYDMLKEFLGNKVASYARWHHEKLDGSGYPDGISGEQIPLESRIMAVADIFDALTTARCYRKAFSFDKALEIMEGDVQNGKIDGEVFAVLKKLVYEGKIVDGVDNMLAIDGRL